MNIEFWPVDKPIDYIRNARKITEEAVAKVASSIAEFGFRQPVVVDGAGVIIIGHARRRAAVKLGMTEIPVHVAADLNAAKVKALRLADNRTGLEVKWDFELVALELGELKDEFGLDLALTGFDPHEIEPLLAADWTPPGIRDEDPLEEENSGPDQNQPDAGPDLKTISVTAEQLAMIEDAANHLRRDEGDDRISLGRACELWAADYLAGAPDEAEDDNDGAAVKGAANGSVR